MLFCLPSEALPFLITSEKRRKKKTWDQLAGWNQGQYRPCREHLQGSLPAVCRWEVWGERTPRDRADFSRDHGGPLPRRERPQPSPRHSQHGPGFIPQGRPLPLNRSSSGACSLLASCWSPLFHPSSMYPLLFFQVTEDL